MINEHGEMLFSHSEVYSNDEICKVFLDSDMTYGKNVYIGIDAPLIFPEDVKEYRTAERELKRADINGFHLSSFQVSKEYMLKTYRESRGEDISRYLAENKKYKI